MMSVWQCSSLQENRYNKNKTKLQYRLIHSNDNWVGGFNPTVA